MASLLRVHSQDLHEHVAGEAGECLESGLYTDLDIRCKGGDVLHAHRLVLAAVSPFLKEVLEGDSVENMALELPDTNKEEVQFLLEIVYNGSIEATLEEMRLLLTLAHSLYISVPVSDQLMKMLKLKLPPLPPLNSTNSKAKDVSDVATALTNTMNGLNGLNGMNGMNPATLGLMQQQIFNQYAMMNGLVPDQPPPKKQKTGLNGYSKSASPPGQEFMCPVCNAKLGSLMGLKQHMALHEQDAAKEMYNNQINNVIHSSFKLDTKLFVCSVCQSSYTNKGNFKQHLEKHVKTGELSVLEDGQDHAGLAMQQKTKTAKDIHSLLGYDSSANAYQCNICQSTYSHPGNFKQHLLKHEREKNNSKARDNNHLSNVLQSAFAERVDNGDPCKTYVCHECQRTFKHPGNFKQHMASHNKPLLTSPNNNLANLKKPMPGLVKMIPKEEGASQLKTETAEWPCPECDEIFVHGITLQTHMKSVHEIEMVLPPEEVAKPTVGQTVGQMFGIWGCDMCSQKFKTEGWMQRHKQKIHGVGMPENGHSILGHSIMEGMPGMTMGSVSPPRGDQDAGLKALAAAAGADRMAMFHCDFPGCFQSFTTEGWLARHRSRQHADQIMETNGENINIYSCKQCGKEFYKHSKLTQHMKTHSPEAHYKYPCDICGKKFTRPQHVTRHKLLHTGERPHACPTCDKSFAREDKLKIHLMKGCSGTNSELDQSLDSRDSNELAMDSRDSNELIVEGENTGMEVVEGGDEAEIDDDEDALEDDAVEVGES